MNGETRRGQRREVPLSVRAVSDAGAGARRNSTTPCGRTSAVNPAGWIPRSLCHHTYCQPWLTRPVSTIALAAGAEVGVCDPRPPAAPRIAAQQRRQRDFVAHDDPQLPLGPGQRVLCPNNDGIRTTELGDNCATAAQGWVDLS